MVLLEGQVEETWVQTGETMVRTYADFDVEALVGSWERTMAVAEEVARYSA